MSFQYTSANEANKVRCNLDVQQCKDINQNTEKRCNRRTAKILPYCSQHAKKQLGLEVKQSSIPNSGFGLFASKLFKKGAAIGPYLGKVFNKYQQDTMYGTARNDVSPYGVEMSKDKIVDSACSRGIGGFANHFPKKSNARLVANGNNVSLKTTKAIKPKSEIFLSYGSSYFSRPNDLPKPSFKTTKHKIKNVTPIPPKKPRT